MISTYIIVNQTTNAAVKFESNIQTPIHSSYTRITKRGLLSCPIKLLQIRHEIFNLNFLSNYANVFIPQSE